MANNKNSSYSKGRRWGYAVAKSSLKTSKANVYKVDKAMKTCSQNARSGCKKLNQNERNAYRGMADGMYDAIMQSEKASAPKQKKASGEKKGTKKKKDPSRKRLKAIHTGYRVDTFVNDYKNNKKKIITSYHPTLSLANNAAFDVEEAEEKKLKNFNDKMMTGIYSVITSNRKRYKLKR